MWAQPPGHLIIATGLSNEKRPEQRRFSYPKFMYYIMYELA